MSRAAAGGGESPPPERNARVKQGPGVALRGVLLQTSVPEPPVVVQRPGAVPGAAEDAEAAAAGKAGSGRLYGVR